MGVGQFRAEVVRSDVDVRGRLRQRRLSQQDIGEARAVLEVEELVQRRTAEIEVDQRDALPRPGLDGCQVGDGGRFALASSALEIMISRAARSTLANSRLVLNRRKLSAAGLDGAWIVDS